MHIWEEYTYDVYMQRDIFVYAEVICMYLIDVCVMNYWDFLTLLHLSDLQCIYLKSLNLLLRRICKFWSTKIHSHVFFPSVDLGDAS